MAQDWGKNICLTTKTVQQQWSWLNYFEIIRSYMQMIVERVRYNEQLSSCLHFKIFL